jgi:hypothetical protein
VKEAFFKHCKDALVGERWFVSLYVRQPFYGGSEEGGWWGSDTSLVATQEFCTEADANRVRDHVKTDELNKDAKRDYGERCLAESEWLAARGLEDDFLPTHGEETYFVSVEEEPGSEESKGCRHYE